jgi:hypothetical protein
MSFGLVREALLGVPNTSTWCARFFSSTRRTVFLMRQDFCLACRAPHRDARDFFPQRLGLFSSCVRFFVRRAERLNVVRETFSLNTSSFLSQARGLLLGASSYLPQVRGFLLGTPSSLASSARLFARNAELSCLKREAFYSERRAICLKREAFCSERRALLSQARGFLLGAPSFLPQARGFLLGAPSYLSQA